MPKIKSLINFAISLCGVFIFLLRYVNSNSDLLLNSVLPTHYTIKLEINMTENNFNYNGESYVDIKIKEPTSFIILQADLEIIGNITVKSDKKTYQSQSYSIHKTTDLLTIQFNETMLKGYYRMYMKYKNQIFKSSVGLTRYSYIDESNQKQWLLMTNFVYFDAHRLFPCFDDQEIKTTFQLLVRHNSKYVALSNTKFKKLVRKKNDTDQVWTWFKKTPMMSTYQLCFVLGKFKTTQVTNSLRVWSTKTAVDYEENFMRIGQKAWNILEDITGITSSEHFLEKLDFVVIPSSPDLSRYMNGIYPTLNWGLCIVNEGDLKKKTYTEGLPNLLTYQWFINSISPDNFHFKSFEHGLSMYIFTVIADKIDESSDWMDQFSFYCREKLDKNASMIRMIATLFGKERFRNAIKSYLLNNNFGELTSTTLIDEFINASKNMSVGFYKILYNWKNTLGNPLVTITRNYRVNTATITQSRFGRYSYKPKKEKYWVPLHCTNEDNLDFDNTSVTNWVNPEINSLEIPAPDYNKWLICNKKQLGFYRVNYDDKNWQLIIKYINSDNYDRIHHLNRAQLIDDTFLLAEIGNVDYRITFNLLKYLEYETHYIPWNSFWKQLSRFHKSALPSSKFYDVFKAFVIMRTKNFEERIFMDDESNDDRYLKSLRKKFIHWTCQFGSNLCKNYTFSKLTKWLEDPKKNSLPNNFKKEILCGGMRKADQKTWNQLWDKFYHHISDQESLNALGCSLDDNILKNFIAKAVEDRFRNIYPWTLFEVIGGQSYRGIDVILETMNSNQTEYNEKFTKYYLIKAGVAGVIKRIITATQYGKLKTILNNNSNIINNTEATKNLKIAEISLNNAQWRFNSMKNFFEETNTSDLI